MARAFTEFLIPFILKKMGKFDNLTIWTNIILSINHLPKEKIEMTSRVFGHILKFYLFIHKKLSNTSITQIQIKIFWYALHFIKTFMQRFRMGTLWLTEKSSCLAFLPPHYFPPITTGWDTLEKSSCYHRFFCACKLEEGTYSQYCIAKGKKSRTGPAIQHTQAPARSRTLFHCVCTRVSEL